MNNTDTNTDTKTTWTTKTFNGIDVSLDHSSRVYFCTDWANIDTLVDAGYLTRRAAGPGTFGHVDYYLA